MWKNLKNWQSLGTAQIDRTASEERFKSLEACFGYTINRLENALRELLPKLLIFKSPFPISAALEIFAVQKSNITNLYNRSLLTRIDSENPEYLLYYIHPALRSYLQNKSDKNLESEYGKTFSRYYLKFLSDTYNEWGKENHVPSIARFNIIAESEYADFDRVIKLAKKNPQVGADISALLGLIYTNLGILSKALEYQSISLSIDEELNDRVGLAGDYTNRGVVLANMEKLQEALESYNEALNIDEELNDKVGMAADYKNIGIVLGLMGSLQEALENHNKSLEIHDELNDRAEIAKDYTNIGNILRRMGKYQEALENHNKALEIDKELEDRMETAKVYYNISWVLSRTNKDEALKSLYNALTILQEFEKENNYRHPLLEKVNNRISYLKG